MFLESVITCVGKRVISLWFTSFCRSICLSVYCTTIRVLGARILCTVHLSTSLFLRYFLSSLYYFLFRRSVSRSSSNVRDLSRIRQKPSLQLAGKLYMEDVVSRWGKRWFTLAFRFCHKPMFYVILFTANFIFQHLLQSCHVDTKNPCAQNNMESSLAKARLLKQQ